jgi:hypothetical protein
VGAHRQNRKIYQNLPKTVKNLQKMAAARRWRLPLMCRIKRTTLPAGAIYPQSPLALLMRQGRQNQRAPIACMMRTKRAAERLGILNWRVVCCNALCQWHDCPPIQCSLYKSEVTNTVEFCRCRQSCSLEANATTHFVAGNRESNTSYHAAAVAEYGFRGSGNVT